MKRLLETAVLGVLFAGSIALSGCGKFFPPITGGGCTVNCTASNFLYVANQKAAGAGIAGYSTTGGTLTAVTGSPFALPVLPTAIAINPANTFLYVGSSTGQLYEYGINSDGSLTANAGNPVANIVTASMQVDSTGAWLLVADAANDAVAAYAINSTTGALTVPTGGEVRLNGGVGGASRLVITPDNLSVYVSLGTAGVEALTFASATGLLTDSGNLVSGAALNSDQGLAVDLASKFLFVTETGVNALRVLSIGASAKLTEVAGSPFKTGLGPSAVLVDASGSYVYVANRTDNTLSAFLLTNSGSLTQISGSPFPTGTTPVAIAEDRSKTYIAVVSEGGTPDLQLYTFDATTAGKLDKSGTGIATGTDPTLPVAIAVVH